ncbi:hypothetical protein BgiBS90_033520 [Biomphalaria glabrata]|nr:hypothetical protein BgiBS90_033520 [Biomphalaria glabrata]
MAIRSQHSSVKPMLASSFLLQTSSCCCRPQVAAADLKLLLQTSSSCCRPQVAAADLTLLLQTSSCCYRPQVAATDLKLLLNCMTCVSQQMSDSQSVQKSKHFASHRLDCDCVVVLVVVWCHHYV